MASLKKPDVRCECGSLSFEKQWEPERWVCTDCATILVSRKPKSDSTKCRECGALRGSKPFKPSKNICLDCAQAKHREWSKLNADHLREYRSRPEFKIKRKASVRKAVQKSPEAFLRALMHHLVKKCNYTKVAKHRYNEVRLTVEVDHAYLVDLYSQQSGRCALSKMPMTYQFNDLRAISIDRIDSGKGYILGNVQLVCQWVNMAKKHYSNAEFLAVLDDLRASDRERVEADLEDTRRVLHRARVCPEVTSADLDHFCDTWRDEVG